MEQKSMHIEVRDKVGKGVARRLRAEGGIPGVVFGKGMEPVPVSVNVKELASVIGGEAGQNTLITLKGDARLDGKTVIVADLQRSALKARCLHVDLHKVDLTEKLRVHVPVAIVGTAEGVVEGGLLDVVMHSIDVECLPTQIPDHIIVDVTPLAIGHAIHVGDLSLPAGVKVLEDPKAPIVSVLGRAKEQEAAAVEA